MLEALRGFDLTLLQAYVLADFPQNVLLFVPLGFGLAGIFLAYHGGKWRSFVLVLVVGLLLSSLMEGVQAVALLRFPTLADVIANGLGAGLGFWLFYLAGRWFWGWMGWLAGELRPFLTLRHLLLFYLLYLAGWLTVSVWMQSLTRFSNWNNQFPLIVGNEQTGDRPWQGELRQFYLADRAFSSEELARLFAGESPIAVSGDSLVAHYDFTNLDADNFPPLIGQGNAASSMSADGVVLSQAYWLESERAVTNVSDALSEASQLTLGLKAATGDLIQSGPARLLSISGDPYNRNMTLGQEGPDLVFRLRMPLTGANGRQPELIVPNVFRDDQMHHIIITYDGTAVRLVIDSADNMYAIELLPAVALFTKSFPKEVDQMRLNRGNMVIFRLLYTACLFLPWAAWLAMAFRYRLPNRLRLILWLVAGFILPPLLWEVLLGLLLRGYDFQAVYVAMGIGMTAFGFCFFILWRRMFTQN